jgi:hypothetical protein
MTVIQDRIAILTTLMVFFYSLGAIARNTTFGKVLVTTVDFLSLSMQGVEIMWSSCCNPVAQKVFGVPIILNLTKTFKTGLGYTVKEASRYITKK